jgi:8-oxo-dGTP pyrophosphatase MutT (NUDIX family)
MGTPSGRPIGRKRASLASATTCGQARALARRGAVGYPIAGVPTSPYLQGLRQKVGTDLLLLPSVTGLLFDARGALLLARHAEGVWVAPGGAVEPDEAPGDAVVREVREETGLEVEPLRVVGAYGGPDFRVTYRNGDRVAYVMIVYECRAIGGRARADGVETRELRWVAREELSGLELPAWARVVLPDAYASRGR